MTVLLFADDLAVLDRTAKGLQRKLDLLQQYCDMWNLQVNEDKTKIMVFTRNTRYIPERDWTYNENTLEYVKTYPYVGILVNGNGNWTAAREERARKGTRAMFAMISNLRRFGFLPVKFLLSLFDKKIAPVLLYGCEIWGLYGLTKVNAIADQFYRLILGLKKNAPTTLARGELGRYSLASTIYTRVMKYWLKLLSAKPELAIRQCYLAQLRMIDAGNTCWASTVRDLLIEIGLKEIWTQQEVRNERDFLKDLKDHIKLREAREWLQNVNLFGSLRFYKTLKNDLTFEPYLNCGFTRTALNMLVRLRGGLLRVASNEGRWYGTDRVCPICNSMNEENELHLVFECIAWNHFRTALNLNTEQFFLQRDFNNLFRNPDKRVLLKLIKFLKLVLEDRQNILKIL
jgi:hypothetical protein